MTLSPLNFIISPRRRLIRGTLIILGMVSLGFGYLQGLDTQGDPKTLWVIDNSLSMLVADIKTNSGIMISRLDLAKNLIIDGTRNIGGEHAIMSAAQGARLELPMTNDTIALANVAHGINILFSGGGSAFVTPLKTIQLIYGNIPNLRIIWITDGEFSDIGNTGIESISLDPLLTEWTKKIHITFIGVGTRLGGPILLGYDTDGRPRYKESEGTRVNSIRDDTELQGVSSVLDTDTIVLETDTYPNYQNFISNGTEYTSLPSFVMIFGICSILLGLMFSRYQYFPNYSNGK